MRNKVRPNRTCLIMTATVSSATPCLAGPPASAITCRIRSPSHRSIAMNVSLPTLLVPSTLMTCRCAHSVSDAISNSVARRSVSDFPCSPRAAPVCGQSTKETLKSHAR